MKVTLVDGVCVCVCVCVRARSLYLNTPRAKLTWVEIYPMQGDLSTYMEGYLDD